MNIWKIESDYLVKNFIVNWNISVHMWLKNYIFIRLVRGVKSKSQKFVPLVVTFLTSAIWHGFYPGYLIFFFCAAIFDYIYKLGENTFVLFLWIPSRLRFLLIFVFTWTITSYWGMAFVLQDLPSC